LLPLFFYSDMLPPGTTFTSFFIYDFDTHVSTEAINLSCVTGNDERISGFDPSVAVYVRDNKIQVYQIVEGGQGQLIIDANAVDLAALPDKPEENTLIESSGNVALYKLTTGEYQINSGPDVSGNVNVVIFSAFPLSDVYFRPFNVYDILDG